MSSGSDFTKQRYDAFLGAVGARLAAQGFARTGHKFRRPRGTEWLFVDVERGRNSDREHMLLRAWVGLTSDSIARFLGYRRLSPRPADWELTGQIGHFFGHYSFEPWWLIEDEYDPGWCAGLSSNIVFRGSVDHVADHFASIVVERVVPSVEQYPSDESLRDLVLRGEHVCGYYRVDPFKAAILTARLGPPDAFERFAAETVARPDFAQRYYGPQIERLRRGEHFAPGYGPGEKGAKPIKAGSLW